MKASRKIKTAKDTVLAQSEQISSPKKKSVILMRQDLQGTLCRGLVQLEKSCNTLRRSSATLDKLTASQTEPCPSPAGNRRDGLCRHQLARSQYQPT